MSKMFLHHSVAVYISVALLVVLSIAPKARAVEFSLLKTSHFKIIKAQGDLWLIPEIQKAFFSKIKVTDEAFTTVVPAVTVNFQVSIKNAPPAKVVKVRVPDEKGIKHDISLTQRSFQGTWALSRLPADLAMELLDFENNTVAVHKIRIESMAGVIAVNQKCLNNKLGLMDPSFAPEDTLFLVCDPTPDISLVVDTASGRSLTWEPEDTEDQSPLPYIAHPATKGPFVSFRIEQKPEQQPERFQLVFRGFNATKEYEPPKRELEMELGLFSANVSQTILPRGDGQVPVHNSITQRGGRGRLAGISHLRSKGLDLEGAIFTTILPLWKDRLGPTTWIWGTEIFGKVLLPFEPGRWSLQAGVGARYENISRIGADSLNHLFGPGVLLDLGYARAHRGDRFFYQSTFSLEQPVGRSYHGNQHRWAHTLGFIARSGAHYAWGFKAQYESYQVGNDDMGFDLGVFSVGSMLRF